MAIRIIPKNIDAVIEVDTEEEAMRVAKLFGSPATPTRDEPRSVARQTSGGHAAPMAKASEKTKAQPAAPDGWEAFIALVRHKPKSMALLKFLKERGTASMGEMIEAAEFETASQVSGAIAGFTKNAAVAEIDVTQVLESTRDEAGQKVYTAGPMLLAASEVE